MQCRPFGGQPFLHKPGHRLQPRPQLVQVRQAQLPLAPWALAHEERVGLRPCHRVATGQALLERLVGLRKVVKQRVQHGQVAGAPQTAQHRGTRPRGAHKDRKPEGHSPAPQHRQEPLHGPAVRQQQAAPQKLRVRHVLPGRRPVKAGRILHKAGHVWIHPRQLVPVPLGFLGVEPQVLACGPQRLPQRRQRARLDDLDAPVSCAGQACPQRLGQVLAHHRYAVGITQFLQLAKDPVGAHLDGFIGTNQVRGQYKTRLPIHTQHQMGEPAELLYL